ncbi:MAG: hypothetical protein KAW00_05185, partial [Dehalococcoidia bacterium]|nr:hypothetical protein [Dehalococcoidia bacterium]
QISAFVNLVFGIICFKGPFNRRELLVNSIFKYDETHFDKIRFSAKIGAVFQPCQIKTEVENEQSRTNRASRNLPCTAIW